MTIYLVIPSWNEGIRLHQTLKQVRQYFPERRTIVVDDGSRPPETLPRASRATLIRHQLNLGKGAALQTGIDHAKSLGASALIIMDADGQHDPKYLPRFRRLLTHHDLVFASRRPRLDSPLIRLFANKLASIYINLVFGAYVSDLTSGYRAFTTRAYSLIKWSSSDYSVETEMVARLGRHKDRLKVIEFPIEPIYADKYKGVTIVHALKILFNTVLWKLSWSLNSLISR